MTKSCLLKITKNAIFQHRKFSQTCYRNAALDKSSQDEMQFSRDLLLNNEKERKLLSTSFTYNIESQKVEEDEFASLLSSNFNSHSSINSIIDTHALVKKLMASGFTSDQAEAVTTAVVRIVLNYVAALETSTVSKANAEITIQKIAAQLAVLKRDMLILEKADFSRLQTENEKLAYELLQLRKVVQDEVKGVRNDLTLDLNLEKSKVKDIHIGHEKLIEDRNNRILMKLADLERELQNIDKKINKENAELQTMFERYKSDTIKLSFGAVATCMTIVLGFYRLWS